MDMLSDGRAGESLVCPVLGLPDDGFNLFLCDTDPHVDLSALHSTERQGELSRGFSETF